MVIPGAGGGAGCTVHAQITSSGGDEIMMLSLWPSMGKSFLSLVLKSLPFSGPQFPYLHPEDNVSTSFEKCPKIYQ